MIKTFCDFCGTYIPNPTSYNTWFLPVWDNSVVVRGGHRNAVLLSEKGIFSEQFCLCNTCVQDITTIIDKYKNDRKRERV